MESSPSSFSSGSAEGASSTAISGDSGSSFLSSDISSPSIYLNLDSYPDAVPDDDDVVLFSYIQRMLEGEDYAQLEDHYNNLVEAVEQPFRDIITDGVPAAAAAGGGGGKVSWIDTNSYSSGDGGLGNGGVSDGSQHGGEIENGAVSSDVSPGGLSVGSNGGWAYDPIELQQLQVVPPAPPSFEELDVKVVASLMDESMLNNAFRKGMEEAQKFLPKTDLLVGGVGVKPFIAPPAVETTPSALGRRKSSFEDNGNLDVAEGRIVKQSATSTSEADEELIRHMLDKMILQGPQCFEEAIKEIRDEKKQEANQGSNGINGKGRGRQRNREVIDLRTLLIHCAQAVSTDDWRSANELLKQIRQNASSTGEATQRLAQCFADGLQARIAGTGSMVYHALVAKRTTAAVMLNAYKIYMVACPFKKIGFFTSNQTILNAAVGVKKIHVIDFGIYYGFQWPCLLQRLSEREGGPPRVRMTGIDNPQPGFRPEERIHLTGRRLADYARDFGVPFEYKAIAAKWETITIEQLEIEPDEVVIVNSLFQFKTLMDESVIAESPRDMVLSMIAKLKPKLFIHGVVNGSYSAPFFVTRFREALFYYSAMFDMLDATVSRENEGRLAIERDIFGRGVLNVVSCEGSERVERPETYKQWQVRNTRAGLQQVPLDPYIVKMAREKVKNFYHKDFVVDEDHHWLLQGWKGRILSAISAWAPSEP